MASPKTAIEQSRMIRPFLEDGIPLACLAADQAVAPRTLRRWVALYRKKALHGLERGPRADLGGRRKIAPRLAELVTAYALQNPVLPVRTILRKVAEIAQREALDVPSYRVVYNIVRTIDPALLTLAHEGSKAYSERYDLVYRREAVVFGPNRQKYALARMSEQRWIVA